MRKFAQVTLVTAANDKGTRCIRPHRAGC